MAKTNSTTISMRAVFRLAFTCLISADTVVVLTLTDSPLPVAWAEQCRDFHFLCSTDELPGILQQKPYIVFRLQLKSNITTNLYYFLWMCVLCSNSRGSMMIVLPAGTKAYGRSVCMPEPSDTRGQNRWQ